MTQSAHVPTIAHVRPAGAAPPWRLLFLLSLLCLLPGCVTRTPDALQPVAASIDTAKVNMLVVTTRKPSANSGELYTGDRGTAISFNSITVSIPPEKNRRIGEVQWPRHSPPQAEKEFSVLSVGRVETRQQLLTWMKRNRDQKRQVLIFVHGFNNTYSDAVFRYAQIVHDAKIDATPILFTWPSRGRVFDYLYDKESANFSRRALEDLIIEASNSPDVSEVTIFAHSMGTYLVSEALRGVAMRNKTISPKVRNVILASPDIDMDVFRREFIEMGPRRPHFTIFTSTKDKALGVSRWLSGGVDRVGGTDLTAYQPVLDQLGVSVIDTSAVDPHDPLGHSAFSDSPEMIRLLGQRLADQTLDGGRARITDRMSVAAAHFASSAADAAADATLSLVDRESSKRKAVTKVPDLSDGTILY